jgi:hypothetical protein
MNPGGCCWTTLLLLAYAAVAALIECVGRS